MESKKLKKMLKKDDQRREEGRKRWDNHDEDLCMLCKAYGEDKRSLFISCFYAINEMVPEVLDLSNVKEFRNRGFYLRICKSCRASFLGYLRKWRNERVALRGRKKDHDGYLLDEEIDEDKDVPIRENGIIVMITEKEFYERRAKKNLTI